MTPYEKERIQSAKRSIDESVSWMTDNKIIQAHEYALTAKSILGGLIEKGMTQDNPTLTEIKESNINIFSNEYEIGHYHIEIYLGNKTEKELEFVKQRILEAVTQQENILRGEGEASKNLQKTHCPQGHEYTPENTYTYPEGNRRCRICAKVQKDAFNERNKL